MSVRCLACDIGSGLGTVFTHTCVPLKFPLHSPPFQSEPYLYGTPVAPLSVYVAGGSSERLTHCRAAILGIRAAGLTITHDWTVCEGYERPSSDLERAAWARADLDGVKRADVVWYLAPHHPSEGSHAELGAAIVLGKRVIVSGMHARRESRIFALLATETYESHAEALARIVELRGTT